MNQSNFRKLTFLILLLLITNRTFSNNTFTDSESIFDRLHYQEMVEVNLELNLTELLETRKNSENQPAVFSYTDQFGKFHEWNIKVKQRGRFRRIKCAKMPPLKLNFKKKDLAEAGLSAFDDMKLVTHCLEDAKKAKALLVREYMAYRIYNQITDQSFRVQFVKINYVDSSNGSQEEQYGLLIEDTAQLRARIQAEKKENAYSLPRERFNKNQVKIVSLFNYMIGNSDWSISGMRNVKVLLRNEKCILVPYDFDFSGLVDAPYTVLKAEHGIASARDRVFLGFEEDSQDLKSTMRYFKKKRKEITDVIKDCTLLSRRDKKIMLRYIDSFYENSEVIRLPR